MDYAEHLTAVNVSIALTYSYCISTFVMMDGATKWYHEACYFIVFNIAHPSKPVTYVRHPQPLHILNTARSEGVPSDTQVVSSTHLLLLSSQSLLTLP